MAVTERAIVGAPLGTKAKQFWHKIGSAFFNANGSIGIQLDSLPINGRVVLQAPRKWGNDATKEDDNGRT